MKLKCSISLVPMVQILAPSACFVIMNNQLNLFEIEPL